MGGWVGWLVGWWVGWLVGWLVGWSVGWLVGVRFEENDRKRYYSHKPFFQQTMEVAVDI